MIRATVLLSFGAVPISAQDIRWPDPVANDVLPYESGGISHGPLLGGVTDTSIKVWLRTRTATDFDVLYSEHLPLTDESDKVSGVTSEQRDLTAAIQLQSLRPNTRYYYAVRIAGALPDLRPEISDAWPSFRTLPNEQTFIDVDNNPDGHFNVTFAIGHCASQDPDVSGGMYTSTPAYDMIRRHHADEAMFGIVNGDVIYEERRDGTLGGIRDNYKLYFSRGRSFAKLFRCLPALFTFDDHDVGWDIHGCGEIGLGEGRHLIRDLGLRGYEEYLSWANHRGRRSGNVRFGKAHVMADSDEMYDPQADFSRLDPATVSTIHLGNYTRGDKMARQRKDAPKGAGVFGLTKVIDSKRLQITPSALANVTLPYSIGTHHYYDWKVANCHFFALDTRGERSNRNPKNRSDPSLFILGTAQEKWFVEGVQNTDADFIFVISPDPWVIYHTAAHVGGDDKDDKGDGFPSFLHQRERLIHLLVTGFPNNLPYEKIRNTYYGIVQVNNVLKVASPKGGYQYSAYEEPQVIVRWHDGYTGKLVYAETITTRDAKELSRNKFPPSKKSR